MKFKTTGSCNHFNQLIHPKGKDLKSVYPRDKKQFITYISNLLKGGWIEDVTIFHLKNHGYGIRTTKLGPDLVVHLDIFMTLGKEVSILGIHLEVFQFIQEEERN